MATMALRAGDLPAPARMRFVATIFAGSFLLFLVQPMIARMALPRLGGAPIGVELGDAGLPGAAARRLRLQPLARPACAAFAGGNPSDRIRRSPRRACRSASWPSTRLPTPTSFLWVPWLLLVSIGPLFFARLCPGAANPALVRLERRRRSLPAVRGVEPRQLLRPDRLSVAGRAVASGRRAAAGVERRLCLARAARRLVRAAAASPIVGGSRSGGGPLDRLAHLRAPGFSSPPFLRG